ncbi:MAG: Gfo/Idh/MocA family oxidoreductase [Alphaproteobacteria bacterium]|nr:Gfo/Idh/MocA family oxidoreductase [Alphaproteobacteria bacterium]
MTPPSRVRGALIGCGHMGGAHARRLLERADVDLVAILDPVPPTEPALAALHRSALPEGLDFAVVAAPTRLHAALTRPLLEAGLAVLVEKPLAATVDEARGLLGHDRLSVGHIERFNPAVAALPEGLRPRYLRAERLSPFRARGTDVDVIHDLMIHDLDLLLHLDGSEVTEVRAVGVPVMTPGVDIADVRLETASGCVASLTASRVSRASARHLRLVSEGAYFSLDLGERTAERVRWGAGQLAAEPLAVPRRDALVALHDAFLAAVRGEGPFPAPAHEALRGLELADEVARRASQARP